MGVVFLLAGIGLSEVPKRINDQMRITDSVTGEPEPEPHDLVFTAFEEEMGGSAVWDEAHNVTADTGHAHDERYYRQDELDAPGSTNDTDNPVDWTRLKNVPEGFIGGTDNVGGVGNGHALDAAGPRATGDRRVQGYVRKVFETDAEMVHNIHIRWR